MKIEKQKACLQYAYFCLMRRHLQKQPLRGAPRKRCSENMQQIYRTPMLKCDFNKVALHHLKGIMNRIFICLQSKYCKLLKTMIPTRLLISFWQDHCFYGVWKSPHRFCSPPVHPCCFVPPFLPPKFQLPLSVYPAPLPLTGWLHISRDSLTFPHSYECN